MKGTRKKWGVFTNGGHVVDSSKKLKFKDCFPGETYVALLIGTDEAGYGPSLGPLVISATAWDCPQREINLYQILTDVVTDSHEAAKAGTQQHRLLIADSKVACRSGRIDKLETTVLLLLELLHGWTPKSLSELVRAVMPDASEDFLDCHFWLKGRDVALPLNLSNGRKNIRQEIGQNLRSRFRNACQQNAIRLIEIRSAILLPPEFNKSVTGYGNKATLLSNKTLRLAAELMEKHSDDTLIECDKHGGRSYYSAMIASALTDHRLKIIKESSEQSVYQWSQLNQECEVRFTAKGERQLPVALASMVSKYVREVFMVAWNDYWATEIPDIKPTKGYPQDAKRFLRAIAKVVKAKRISQHEFWRNC